MLPLQLAAVEVAAAMVLQGQLVLKVQQVRVEAQQEPLVFKARLAQLEKLAPLGLAPLVQREQQEILARPELKALLVQREQQA